MSRKKFLTIPGTSKPSSPQLDYFFSRHLCRYPQHSTWLYRTFSFIELTTRMLQHRTVILYTDSAPIAVLAF
jgi:hypothetical protein